MDQPLPPPLPIGAKPPKVFHGTLAIIVGFTLTSLSTIVVALRFYCRYVLVRKLAAPDWVMLAALVTTWCSAVVNYYSIIYMDYTHVHDAASFAQVTRGALLTMWLFRLNYMVNHLLIKISILLFYCYMASTHRTFQRIVRVFLAIIVLASLTQIFVSILICRPIAAAWSAEVFILGMQHIKKADCMDPTPLWLFNASINLATDILLWFLPLPFFLNLRTMPVRRRLELIAIFSIGIVAVVASAVRLSVTKKWLSSFVQNGLQAANLLIWSQVEQHAGIIAASIPFLRPLARKAIRATRSRDGPISPGAAAKLVVPDQSDLEKHMAIRTPIIPSPAPTYGSEEIFRVPSSPLASISPVPTRGLAMYTV